jgi:hypothetical protein
MGTRTPWAKSSLAGGGSLTQGLTSQCCMSGDVRRGSCCLATEACVRSGVSEGCAFFSDSSTRSDAIGRGQIPDLQWQWHLSTETGEYLSASEMPNPVRASASSASSASSMRGRTAPARASHLSNGLWLTLDQRATANGGQVLALHKSRRSGWATSGSPSAALTSIKGRRPARWLRCFTIRVVIGVARM